MDSPILIRLFYKKILIYGIFLMYYGHFAGFYLFAADDAEAV